METFYQVPESSLVFPKRNIVDYQKLLKIWKLIQPVLDTFLNILENSQEILKTSQEDLDKIFQEILNTSQQAMETSQEDLATSASSRNISGSSRYCLGVPENLLTSSTHSQGALKCSGMSKQFSESSGNSPETCKNFSEI